MKRERENNEQITFVRRVTFFFSEGSPGVSLPERSTGHFLSVVRITNESREERFFVQSMINASQERERETTITGCHCVIEQCSTLMIECLLFERNRPVNTNVLHKSRDRYRIVSSDRFDE
jgi:hypothetical protein